MASSPVPSAAAFDSHATDYDRLRRGLVPCFDGFYGAALDRIEAWYRDAALEPQPLSVLDLGAGTGLFSRLLLERFPSIRLRLLDASASMLEQAQARLSFHPDLVLSEADLATADLGDGHDLIISALAIHHLNDAAKRDLFTRINRALVPGGLFVNAEQVLGPTPHLEQLYAQIWEEQAESLGVPRIEIEEAKQRMRHDRCATVADQLHWLTEARFTQVDCCFKSWRFAVYSGVRAQA